MSTQATDESQDWFRGRLASGKDWQEVVAWVGDLPPLPDVASQAIVLVENPNTNAAQLTNILGKDPALAARVLKIANSAMFARRREITTLAQAIVLIGFKALKGIIVAATVRQLSRDVNKIEQLVWENSACTATAAQMIATKVKKNLVDEAFMYGLLHDLGKMVLLRQIPGEYDKVFAQTQTGMSFVDAEQQILGYAHPLIGALVAKKWNFSQDTCLAILHHHDPMPPAFESNADHLSAIIQAADGVAHTLGYGHGTGYPDNSAACSAQLEKLGLAVQEQAALIDEIKKAYAEQKGALM